MEISKTLKTETGWEVIETEYNKSQAITAGSNFMIGNGYLGYRGTFSEDGAEEYAGCIVSDTWDKSDGKWEELCTVPNALYTKIYIDDEEFSMHEGNSDYFRKIDLKHAINSRKVVTTLKNGITLEVNEEKFASYDNKHLVAMKLGVRLNRDAKVKIETGIDTAVWSINGNHFRSHDYFSENKTLGVMSDTVTHGDKIVVLEKCIAQGEIPQNQKKENEKYLHEMVSDVKAGEELVIEKFMLVYSTNDVDDPKKTATEKINTITSYEAEKSATAKCWDDLWKNYNIEIEGNMADQVALRFNIYHSIIATPVHKSLPIGARGLSCQAYQGAAFWDQEIYNMPMFLYCTPEIAKKVLIYRYNTLDGARRKAKRLGYEGAYYAWISGKTGDELCPDFFFKDVLTGRDIRNHFNDWQIHISPDIAYAIKKYVGVTGDFEFVENYGAEMLFEIVRFLASFMVYKPRRNRYEIIRVQGPDEYHENVDNNAFTNYQTFFAYEFTLEVIEKLSSEKFRQIAEKVNLSDEEIALWKDIKEKIYLPKPNDEKILEQFDGYFDLESIVPASKVTERLQDEGEYYGWPNGIAVFTQCLKQADVIQLFCLHPKLFGSDTVRAGYDYYEPRTLHFSSLSPSSYSIVASQLGKIDEAYKNFRKSINIDLLNTNEAVSGGTFIGGIHTAACGAAWQMVINGFAGFTYEDDVLYLNPQLPQSWEKLTFSLHIKGNVIKISLTKSEVIVERVAGKSEIKLNVFGKVSDFKEEKAQFSK